MMYRRMKRKGPGNSRGKKRRQHRIDLAGGRRCMNAYLGGLRNTLTKHLDFQVALGGV